MKTAAQIMKRKAFIKAEMDQQLAKEQSDALWARAAVELEDILNRYSAIPKGEHTHTDNFIFPSAAIYLTVKGAVGAQQAYRIIENAAISNTAAIGRKLAGMMKIPGFSSLFVSLWNPISRKMFGEKSGFRNIFYTKKKGEYRMDIITCPYNKYFIRPGCPELTKIFCDNDERTYGDLPGLQFTRHTTLGKGGACCDFLIKKV